MFNLTVYEKRVIIWLCAFAVLGLAVLAYRNYFASPELKVVSRTVDSRVADYENLLKRSHAVNINKAQPHEMMSLAGIGPKLAKRIVDYRNANGPFLFKEDLMKVKGIGEGVLESIKEYITLD